MSHAGIGAIYHDVTGNFVPRVPIVADNICFLCNLSEESTLLVRKECPLNCFVGNFVRNISYVADYEVIKFLDVGIKVLLVVKDSPIWWQLDWSGLRFDYNTYMYWYNH